MVDVDLTASIQRYRTIIEHAQQLEQLLTTGDPEQLLAYTARLQALQTEAGLYDRELLEEMAADFTRWQDHPLFQQRLQLSNQIVEMNNLLLPRVRGMMAVTAAELTQLKEGRIAVSGYHPELARGEKSIRGIG